MYQNEQARESEEYAILDFLDDFGSFVFSFSSYNKKGKKVQLMLILKSYFRPCTYITELEGWLCRSEIHMLSIKRSAVLISCFDFWG